MQGNICNVAEFFPKRLLNLMRLLKKHDMTLTEKLLQSNSKKQNFLLHGNRNLAIKKGKLECGLS